jgi:hypothetical protein
MEVWFDNDRINIVFGIIPSIGIRYIVPSMSEEEKKSVKKYPFINKLGLRVFVKDKKKSQIYDFIIPKGYCFDGASVPRLFWRIIGPNTDNKFLVAAMVHDYICEHHDCINYDRALSTLIFDSLLKASGIGNLKRFCMKNSVNIFQKYFCNWRV